jgi:hypothetical protein
MLNEVSDKPDLSHGADFGSAGAEDREEKTAPPGPLGRILLGRLFESSQEMVGQFEAVESDDCPECGGEDSEDEEDVARAVGDSLQECSLKDRRWGELALVWWWVSVLVDIRFLLWVEGAIGDVDGGRLFPDGYICPRSGVEGLKAIWFTHFFRGCVWFLKEVED